MKKWIGIFVILSVFVLSIKPTYARFVDTKNKTLESIKLVSPKDNVSVSIPSTSLSFDPTSNKVSMPIDIKNDSTYTFNQLAINIDSVTVDGNKKDDWQKYYTVEIPTILSSDNLLLPSKKEKVTENQFTKQILLGITTTGTIPTGTFKFNLSLKFTSIGGTSITKNTEFSVAPKSITSDNLKLTGQQNIDFSKSTSEWQGTSENGTGEATPWTLTNNTGIELTGLNISVIRAKAYSSAENANETDISNSWQNYFGIRFGKNATEDGTYVKTMSATPGSKNEFYISAKQLIDISSYRGFKLTIAVTCGNDPNLSITKDVNITPRTTGIYNDLSGDLGDLGIAGYFHIFSKENVSYSVSQEKDINIVSKNVAITNDLQSQGLINYIASSFQVGTQVTSNNTSKFVFGNNVNYSNVRFNGNPQIIRDNTSNQYIDIDSEFTKLSTLSNSINEKAQSISALSFTDQNNQQINKSATDNKDYILLKMPSSYLSNYLTSLNIVNNTNKVIIINVYNDTNNTEITINTEIKYNDSILSGNVLWNFAMNNNSKIKIKNNFVGTILAPNLSIDVDNNGHLRGGMIAQNVAVSSTTARTQLPAFHLN